MPLHDTNIALFGSLLGPLRGIYRDIILFEGGVRAQALQLPGSHLGECCCAAQYLLLYLLCTCPPHMEWLHSPRLSGMHPQTWVLMGQWTIWPLSILNPAPSGPDVLH